MRKFFKTTAALITSIACLSVLLSGIAFEKIKAESSLTRGELLKGFDAQLASFPESYRPYLSALHQQYPNWQFVADYVRYDFWNSVSEQSKNHRKLVSMNDKISWRSMGKGNYNWSTGEWTKSSGEWTDASKEVIAYYMDPRNFLNSVDMFIFFEQTYDSKSQTAQGVENIIKNTFLAKGYNDPNEDPKYRTNPNESNCSYVKVIMDAAEQSGVSPYIIASTIIIEQGVNGTSPLISGKYQGYEGYYNFFNVEASGNDIYGNGLKYAENNGWSTRAKAIIGGAKFYGNNYVNEGQDTYYYKDFDILDSVPYTHQYAQSIYDAKVKASKIKSQYIENREMSLIFRIPIYKNMPATPPAYPPENNNYNNYYFTDISAFGMNPAFDMYTQNYSMSVSGDTAINVKFPNTAAYVSENTFSLKKGENTVRLNVKAQSGHTNTYIFKISAEKDCKLIVSTDVKTVKRGDANGDGAIDIIDLAAVRMHILGIRTLTNDFLTGADANADVTVDIIDLAAIRMNILGLINL